MKNIDLTRGLVAIVDDEDYDKLIARGNWLSQNPGDYAFRTEYVGDRRIRRKVYMHRLVLGLPPGKLPEVDHIDGNPLNNQKYNLRQCTHAQNAGNQKRRSDNTSGVKGVSWNKCSKRWEVNVKVNYRHFFVGYFTEIEDAAKAYAKAAKVHFGEFARTV